MMGFFIVGIVLLYFFYVMNQGEKKGK